MKVSNHAKLRIRERTDLNHHERKNLFKSALEKGKSPQDIKDERIRRYLESKQRKAKVKLYLDYVFVYSKNNKQLYTMYKLPAKVKKDKVGDTL